jgi:hypothetical protein
MLKVYFFVTIDLIDDLLQTSLTVIYKRLSLKIDHLVIDTGAAHSLLSSDIVSQIEIKFHNGDKLI